MAASAAQPRAGSKDKRKLCAPLCNFEYAAQQHLPPSCSALAASGALCEWQLQHSLSVSFRRKLGTASQHGKLAGKSSSDDTVHCDEYRYQMEAGRRYNNRDAREARNELAMEQTHTHRHTTYATQHVQRRLRRQWQRSRAALQAKAFFIEKSGKSAALSHSPAPPPPPLLYTSRFPLCFAKLRLSNWKSLRQLTGTRQACVPSFPALTLAHSAQLSCSINRTAENVA